MDGAQEGSPAPVSEKKAGRGTAWLFIEMLCAFLAVSAVNNKLAEGRKKSERLLHQNEAFKFQVQSKWDDKVWVDQHGNAETKKTPTQCIAERVQDIKEDTLDTAISAQYTTITKLARNVWLPNLRKLLDPQGGIRTGQVKEDVIEALRLQYFQYKQELGKKPQTEDAQRVQAAKDKFHPPEFYVFVQQGPLVIGGQNNVNLLETPADMQQALGSGGGRKKLREQNGASVQEEARSSKRQAVTCALSSALMHAARSPGGSSTSSVPSSASTFASSVRGRERDSWMVLDKLDRQTAAVRELMEYTTCPEEKKKLIEKQCALLRKMAELDEEVENTGPALDADADCE
jgi:hypothetical protein